MKTISASRGILFGCAGSLFLIFILVVAGILGFGGGENKHLLLAVTSPDGGLEAQIYQFVAPMHGGGGPDYVEVCLKVRGSRETFPIYRRTFLCSDHSGYGLDWKSAKSLNVSVSSCEDERYPQPGHNAVRYKLDECHGVSITYRDNGKVYR